MNIVTYYTYHHGYYDGIGHEFRGFGMVEQYDTEGFHWYYFAIMSRFRTPVYLAISSCYNSIHFEKCHIVVAENHYMIGA